MQLKIIMLYKISACMHALNYCWFGSVAFVSTPLIIPPPPHSPPYMLSLYYPTSAPHSPPCGGAETGAARVHRPHVGHARRPRQQELLWQQCEFIIINEFVQLLLTATPKERPTVIWKHRGCWCGILQPLLCTCNVLCCVLYKICGGWLT